MLSFGTEFIDQIYRQVLRRRDESLLHVQVSIEGFLNNLITGVKAGDCCELGVEKKMRSAYYKSSFCRGKYKKQIPFI